MRQLYGKVGDYDKAGTQGRRRNNSVQEMLISLCRIDLPIITISWKQATKVID